MGHRFVVCGVAIWLAAACGASGAGTYSGEAAPSLGPPEAFPITGTFFVPGESMRFELSLRGILGGQAALAVGQPGEHDGRQVIVVRSQVASAGVVAMFKEVRDDVTTTINMATGLPVVHHAEVKFGPKERVIDSVFADGEAGDFKINVRRVDIESRRTYRQKMPDGLAPFDAHSVLGAVRAWRAEPGQHVYLFSLVGRRLWQNTLRFTGRERITTKFGTFNALRIDGVGRRMRHNLTEDTRKPARNFTLWISDDQDRLPILITAKTEYGDVRAELVDYSQPAALHAVR